MVKGHIVESRQWKKDCLNARARNPTFQLGDAVFYCNPPTSSGLRQKISIRWESHRPNRSCELSYSSSNYRDRASSSTTSALATSTISALRRQLIPSRVRMMPMVSLTMTLFLTFLKSLAFLHFYNTFRLEELKSLFAKRADRQFTKLRKFGIFASLQHIPTRRVEKFVLR